MDELLPVLIPILCVGGLIGYYFLIRRDLRIREARKAAGNPRPRNRTLGYWFPLIALVIVAAWVGFTLLMRP